MSGPLKRKAADLAAAEAKKPKANGNIASFFGAPKAAASATATDTSKPNSDAAALPKSTPPPSAPVVRFDKEKWVAKLTDEQKELLQLEIDTLHESWLVHLKEEIVTPEFLALKRFLKKEIESGKKIFPPMEDVYSWSRHTPLPTVKALILGQDPYHNVNQAHGLCFSVRPPTRAPQSLLNIYIALKNDFPGYKPPPNHGGLLTPWAKQGVLMLNTVLTVHAHEANSHQGKGWERFTQKVIDTVMRVRARGVVVLAWGGPAKGRVKKVDRKRHCVLESVHPSPLSARNGFFTCGHFKKANEWLKANYGAGHEIDWDLNVPVDKAGI